MVAIATIIGSLGNGPLAAVFWQHGVAFAGVMTFLASDFLVPPSLKINANYYGWPFGLYARGIFAAAAVVYGVVVHAVFALVGLIPQQRGHVIEMATFDVNYTFFLNLLAASASVGLLIARKRWRPGGQRSSPQHAPRP